jgi:hypothetical protein
MASSPASVWRSSLAVRQDGEDAGARYARVLARIQRVHKDCLRGRRLPYKESRFCMRNFGGKG